MAGKHSYIKRSSFGRSLSVSLAGIRAGSAFALDGAVQKLTSAVIDREPDFESRFARREARRFVAELSRLKGSYVKIGQMLALLGEHFLPPVLTNALHELASGTEPLPWNAIEPILEQALGDRYRELDVQQQPVGSASLSQVHRARVIATGEQICLKIQFPGLADVIDADFDAVVRMLLLSRWIKAGRELDDWLAAMRAQLHNEIDYLQEAQMMDQVAGLLAEGAGELEANGVHFHVPRLYPRYSNAQLLGMEFIDGCVVSRQEISNLSQQRRNQLGKSMLELFFYELFHWGALQTDPNFGNYLIRPSTSVKGRDELVLLDFGSFLTFEDDFLIHLGNTIVAGQVEDRELMYESLIGLGCLREDSKKKARRSFINFCLHLLEPLRPPDRLPPEYLNDKGEYCWGNSKLINRVGDKALNSAATRHFTIPSRGFAVIARKLTGVFTFISVLNAEFNGHEIVHRHIDKWLEEG